VAKAGTVRKGVGTGSTLAPQTTFTFSNSTPITIPDSGAATPYPSNITVSGVPIGSLVRVRLNNLSHTFHDDIDILLVGPGGQKFILFSDVGSGTVANVTYTLDDAAANFLPVTGQPPSGSYKPANYALSNGGVCQDPFPAPAPAGPYSSPGGQAPFGGCGTDTLTSTFGSTNPNGTWSLYVVDDSAQDSGQIAGGWDLLFDVPTPAVGDLVISEFRINGPGGNRSNDEFIEVQNVSNKTLDLSGLKLRIDNSGFVYIDVVINNGTFLLPGQHFLAAHSPDYSLSAVATPDQTFSVNMVCGAQLTRADNTALDQVGVVCAGALDTGEGTRLTRSLGDFNTQSSFVRKLNSGTPQDTNNNAADFVQVAVDGNAQIADAVLGAPGPENTQSPTQQNATVKTTYIDSGCTTTIIGPDNSVVGGTCPRNRNPTPDAANNSDFGTLAIRRTFINHTGHQVTALRFRIVDVTTQNSPGTGLAELRGRNSHVFSPFCVSAGGGCGGPGGRAIINGTTLEAPTAANNGGLNTSLVVNPFGTDGEGTLTLVNPLADGAGISLQFLLGVKQTGSYRFFINIEALP
jgi:subtilisin-like proprotein convertase family protein